MSELSQKSCIPCQGGVPPLAATERERLLLSLPLWACVDGHHLTRSLSFVDFLQGLEFVKAAAEIAETEGHHPELTLAWGEVRIAIWTHKIDGLTESDFILAAKYEELYQAQFAEKK